MKKIQASLAEKRSSPHEKQDMEDFKTILIFCKNLSDRHILDHIEDSFVKIQNRLIGAIDNPDIISIRYSNEIAQNIECQEACDRRKIIELELHPVNYDKIQHEIQATSANDTLTRYLRLREVAQRMYLCHIRFMHAYKHICDVINIILEFDEKIFTEEKEEKNI